MATATLTLKTGPAKGQPPSFTIDHAETLPPLKKSKFYNDELFGTIHVNNTSKDPMNPGIICGTWNDLNVKIVIPNVIHPNTSSPVKVYLYGTICTIGASKMTPELQLALNYIPCANVAEITPADQ